MIVLPNEFCAIFTCRVLFFYIFFQPVVPNSDWRLTNLAHHLPLFVKYALFPSSRELDHPSGHHALELTVGGLSSEAKALGRKEASMPASRRSTASRKPAIH